MDNEREKFVRWSSNYSTHAHTQTNTNQIKSNNALIKSNKMKEKREQSIETKTCFFHYISFCFLSFSIVYCCWNVFIYLFLMEIFVSSFSPSFYHKFHSHFVSPFNKFFLCDVFHSLTPRYFSQLLPRLHSLTFSLYVPNSLLLNKSLLMIIHSNQIYLYVISFVQCAQWQFDTKCIRSERKKTVNNCEKIKSMYDV